MKTPPAFSIVIAAVFAQGSAWSQEYVDHWTFGGRGGERWADWVEVNVMADDFSLPGVLQPRELVPGENLLPQLYHTVPWERYQEPANPLWEDGLPRLWRWTGNRARSYTPRSPISSTGTSGPSAGSPRPPTSARNGIPSTSAPRSRPSAS